MAKVTMRAWEYSATSGGLEKNLTLNPAVGRPEAKSKDQILVEVLSASLNPADYKVPELGGKLIIRTPATPGLDFCGRVNSKDGNPPNDKFKPNQLVFGRLAGPGRMGTLAEFVVAPVGGITALPEGVDHIQGAAMGTCGLTAYQSIVPNVQSGSKVFINGGSGGTGTFGIQIAKAIGCHVTTSCSTKNIGLCKELGADEVIDYTKGSIVEALKGKGQIFDLFVDNVGNDGALYKMGDRFMKPGAKYVQVGMPPSVRGMMPIVKNALVPKVLGGGKQPFVFLIVKNSTSDLAQIAKWMGEGKVKAVIDTEFSFEDAPKAFEKLRTGRAQGKIIVKVSDVA